MKKTDEKMPMQKLLDVQKVDLTIQDLETEAAAIPRKIREWDNALGARKEELAELKKEFEEEKKDQRRVERLLEQKQTDLSKLNAKLPLIKTNREYKAILLEVDMVEKEISDLEEEILKKMDEVEVTEAKLKQKEGEIKEEQSKIQAEKEKLGQRQKALLESLKGTRSARENLAAGVESTLLSQYDRIRLHKGGLALARVDDESCGACHMALPPQLVNEVIGGRVKSCPSCSRLLYWVESASNQNG